MAAKKTTVERAAAAAAAAAVQASNDAIVIDDSDDEELAAEHEALQSLREFDDGSGGIKFYLCAVSGPAERQGTLESNIQAVDIPGLMDRIIERYGPGKYRVYATRGGRFIPGSNRVINISSMAPRPAAPAAPPAASSQPDWMRSWEERNERLRQEQREDRKNWLTLAFGALGTLGPALLTAMKPTSVLEQAQALAALKSLGDSKDPEKMLELLMKGLELGKDMGGGSDSWPSLVREGLAGAKSLLEGRQTAAPPAPLPAPLIVRPAMPPGAIAAAPAAGPAAPPGAPLGDPMLEMARPLLLKLARDLVDFAENATDPGLAAEALVAKIPSAISAMVQPAQVLGWLTDAAWWTHASAFHAPLAPYRDFCDKVRLELIAMFSQAPAEAATGE